MGIEERIKNIITDEVLKYIPGEKPVKKGFFAGSYLKGFRGAASLRFLATEDFVRRAVSQGARELRVPERTIITPLARELLDEKNMKVNYE